LFTFMEREPKTVNLSLVDSQGKDSKFLVKSLYVYNHKVSVG